MPELAETPIPTHPTRTQRAMSTEENATGSTGSTTRTDGVTGPPTTPCTVVWSQGRPFVLESGPGRPRWMGTDNHGRPRALTREDLRRRGWSYRRAS
ncbi:hypothetical protein SAMN05421630_11011 [Prauserella marina]|uniref:Uncharacterized protein n=2 Tax=Prauserella marina TaxID=530584 RepID=A0A1G6VWI6_9PSEU|nr:hypothetical protein DES30_10811 [Prauserella marina]SDD57176.1 hypothetical protein SAMN05421630_11011 [Prauserella marina]